MKGASLVLPDLVDHTDVGVVESGGGTSLALEAFACRSVVQEFIGEQLQGYVATEAEVLRLVHHTHPAVS